MAHRPHVDSGTPDARRDRSPTHSTPCQHSHDRQAQAGAMLARVEARCRASGARLTPIRRAVLQELLADHRPLGAYELLERVSRREGRRLAPISVYRALDFLVDGHFVHRLASRNAFIACPHTHDPHVHPHGRDDHGPVAFLICGTCGGVDEMASPAMAAALAEASREAGFTALRQVIEISGMCGHCRKA